MKQKLQRYGQYGKNAPDIRREFEFFYNQKFFNKFLGRIRADGLTYQQFNYIMRQMWGTGTLSTAKIPFTETLERPEGELVFAPWVMADRYNIYDFPVMARMINTRGVSFIPSKALKVDEEIVIGWIQPNHKSVYSSISAKVKQLVDIEMTMRTNMKASKTPWMFGISPENKESMKNLAENLESDEPNLFVQIEDIEKAKALTSGAGFNVDKLEVQRQKIENDILTILGVNNVGIADKKEHLIVDEVNANNQAVEESGDSYVDMLNEWATRIKDAFGKDIRFELKEIKKMDTIEEAEEEENYEEN